MDLDPLACWIWLLSLKISSLVCVCVSEKEMAMMDKIQSETEKEVDQKLGKTAQLIRDLERSQNERLNRKPPPHLQYIQGPSDQEHAIAEKLTQQLKELTAKVRPTYKLIIIVILLTIILIIMIKQQQQ